MTSEWVASTHKRMARIAGLVTAVALAALLMAGCTQSAGKSPARRVELSFCGGALRSQPGVIDISCSDNGVTARQLRWSGWGRSVATATGSAVVDLCAYEECFAGNYVTVPIVVITSKIRQCPGHRQAYSRMQYVFVGSSPYKGLSATSSIPDGSIVPSDPGNQTAILGC